MKFVCLNNNVLVGQEGEHVYVALVGEAPAPVWRKVEKEKGEVLTPSKYEVAILCDREYWERLLQCYNASKELLPFHFTRYTYLDILMACSYQYHAIVFCTANINDMDKTSYLLDERMPDKVKQQLVDVLPQGWGAIQVKKEEKVEEKENGVTEWRILVVSDTIYHKKIEAWALVNPRFQVVWCSSREEAIKHDLHYHVFVSARGDESDIDMTNNFFSDRVPAAAIQYYLIDTLPRGWITIHRSREAD